LLDVQLLSAAPHLSNATIGSGVLAYALKLLPCLLSRSLSKANLGVAKHRNLAVESPLSIWTIQQPDFEAVHTV